MERWHREPRVSLNTSTSPLRVVSEIKLFFVQCRIDKSVDCAKAVRWLALGFCQLFLVGEELQLLVGMIASWLVRLTSSGFQS